MGGFGCRVRGVVEGRVRPNTGGTSGVGTKGPRTRETGDGCRNRRTEVVGGVKGLRKGGQPVVGLPSSPNVSGPGEGSSRSPEFLPRHGTSVEGPFPVNHAPRPTRDRGRTESSSVCHFGTLTYSGRTVPPRSSPPTSSVRAPQSPIPDPLAPETDPPYGPRATEGPRRRPLSGLATKCAHFQCVLQESCLFHEAVTNDSLIYTRERDLPVTNRHLSSRLVHLK